MGRGCFSASFPLVKPGRFECTCLSSVPSAQLRVAVVRGRERFLIAVLWPERHVRALGGLTQMTWGPADCSATLGGRLGYSFSLDLWSGFEAAHFRSSLLLFKKRWGEEVGVRGERSPTRPVTARSLGALRLALVSPPRTSQHPLTTKSDTFEMQSKCAHWKKEERWGKKTVKATKYHQASGRVLGSFHTNWTFLGMLTSSLKGSPSFAAGAQGLGFSIQSTAPTSHTCTVAKKPQKPEPPSPGLRDSWGQCFTHSS